MDMDAISAAHKLIIRASNLAELEAAHKELSGEIQKNIIIKAAFIGKQQDLQKIQDLDQTVQDLDQTVQDQDQTIQDQDQTIQDWSLFASLGYGEKLQLANLGSGSSNTRPSNHLPIANLTEYPSAFSRRLDADLLTLGDYEDSEAGSTFREKLKSRKSVLGGTNVKYFNEADLQGLVGSFLSDAIGICSILLGIDEGLLVARREASLLSNKPDHSCVYIRDRTTPLVVFEDKVETDSTMKSKKTQGQVFDQLVDTQMLSWKNNAVGVLTSVQCTRVAWIGSRAHTLITEEDVYSKTQLKMAAKVLESRVENITPNSKLTRFGPVEQTAELRGTKQVQPNRSSRKKRKLDVHRSLAVSPIYEKKDVMHIFCCAILAGIILSEEDPFIDTLPIQTSLNRFCLVLTDSAAAKHGNMEQLDCQVQGPAQKPKLPRALWKQQKFFILGWIGSGDTSKALRAVTADGYECVVKVYVLEYDDNDEKIPAFEAQAKAAIETEMGNYKAIYPKLNDYVWSVKLCYRHCLVLPFFRQLNGEERSEYVPKIKSRYQEILDKGFFIKRKDVRWRHVGLFNEEVYIFDLGDLLKRQDNAADSTCDDSEGDPVRSSGEYTTILLGRLGEANLPMYS